MGANCVSAGVPVPSRLAITMAAVTPRRFSAAYTGSFRDCHWMI